MGKKKSGAAKSPSDLMGIANLLAGGSEATPVVASPQSVRGGSSSKKSPKKTKAPSSLSNKSKGRKTDERVTERSPLASTPFSRFVEPLTRALATEFSADGDDGAPLGLLSGGLALREPPVSPPQPKGLAAAPSRWLRVVISKGGGGKVLQLRQRLALRGKQRPARSLALLILCTRGQLGIPHTFYSADPSTR